MNWGVYSAISVSLLALGGCDQSQTAAQAGYQWNEMVATDAQNARVANLQEQVSDLRDRVDRLERRTGAPTTP